MKKRKAGTVLTIEGLSRVQALVTPKPEGARAISMEVALPVTLKCSQMLIDGASSSAAHLVTFEEVSDDRAPRSKICFFDNWEVAKLSSRTSFILLMQSRLSGRVIVNTRGMQF